MGKKKSAQAARLHFAGKIDVVDLASDSISPLLRDRCEPVPICADSCLCGFFNSAARQRGRIFSPDGRPGWIKYSRTEVGHSMFDHPPVESVAGRRGACVYPYTIAICAVL